MNEPAFLAIATAVISFSIIWYVIAAAGLWKIFTKAGVSGWMAIIPVLNIAMIFKITWGHWLFALLMLIPWVCIVFWAIAQYKLAKAFHRGIKSFLGLLFLTPVFYIILGFGSAKYKDNNKN